MKKRNARVRELLGIFLPLAHAIGNILEQGPEMSRLLALIYNIQWTQDTEAFQVLLRTLRAEGLADMWQFVWDRALDMACAKEYEDGRRSLLIAIPLLAPWSGECRGADRKALTQALKKQGVVPQRGKLIWFPKPQSLNELRDTSPLDFWMLNTPRATEPLPWDYTQATMPTIYLLIGRLEFPKQTAPHWPSPDLLLLAQAEALGWSPDTLDACAPLRWFLERDAEEPETTEDRLMEMVLSAVAAARNRAEELELRTEDCKIIVGNGPGGMLHLSLQPHGRSKSFLCGLDCESAGVPREQTVEKLTQVLEKFSFTVIIGGTDGRPGVTLH